MTIDLPLLTKTAIFAQASRISIVLILGGFYMMMSFEGGIGTLKAGSSQSKTLTTNSELVLINQVKQLG